MASDANCASGKPGPVNVQNPSTAVHNSDRSLVVFSPSQGNANPDTTPYLRANVYRGPKPTRWRGAVVVLHPGSLYEDDPLKIITVPTWWPDSDVDYDTVMSFAFAITGVGSEEDIKLTSDRAGEHECQKHVKLKQGEYYLFVKKEPCNIAPLSHTEYRPDIVEGARFVEYDKDNYPILKTMTDYIPPKAPVYEPNTDVVGVCFLPSAWQRVKSYDTVFDRSTQCQVTGLRYSLEGAHMIPDAPGVSGWWKKRVESDKTCKLNAYPNIMKLQHSIHKVLDAMDIVIAALPVTGCPQHSTRLALIVPAWDSYKHDTVSNDVVADLHRRQVHCLVEPSWILLHVLYLRFVWTFIFHQIQQRVIRTSPIMLLRSSVKDRRNYYVVRVEREVADDDKSNFSNTFVVPGMPSTPGGKKRKSESSSYAGTPSHQSSSGGMGPPASPYPPRTPSRGGGGQQTMSDADEADYDTELDKEQIITSVEDWLYKTPDDGTLNTPGLTTGATVFDRSDLSSDDFDARLPHFPDDDVFMDGNPPGQSDNSRQGGNLFADDGSTKRARQDDVDLQNEQKGHAKKTHLSAEEDSEQVVGHPKVITSQLHDDGDVVG